MRVAIVHNEVVADETDPSTQDVLDQERYISAALKEAGHTSRIFPLDRDVSKTLSRLRRYKPDCIFNLVESVQGYAALHPCAAALWEMIGIPHTGSPAAVLDRSTDKALTKTMLAAAGIRTPKWAVCRESTSCWKKIPGPWIVKPLLEDASVGIEEDSVVRDAAAVGRKLREMRRRFPDQPILVEKFIDGREFNISILAMENGPTVLPPAEMVFLDWPPGKERVVGFKAKWDRNAFEYHHTARRFDFPPEDAKLIERIKRIALRCWKVIGCRGYARVDIRVDEKSRVYVIEVNANPCLAPDAGFVAAASRAGISPARMVQCILEDLVCVPPLRRRKSKSERSS